VCCAGRCVSPGLVSVLAGVSHLDWSQCAVLAGVSHLDWSQCAVLAAVSHLDWLYCDVLAGVSHLDWSQCAVLAAVSHLGWLYRCCAGRCVSPGLVVQVHLLVAPPRTRLVPYLRLGLGDVLVQLLSFLSRLVAVREYTLSGQSL